MKEYAGYTPFMLRCEDYMRGVNLVIAEKWNDV